MPGVCPLVAFFAERPPSWSSSTVWVRVQAGSAVFCRLDAPFANPSEWPWRQRARRRRRQEQSRRRSAQTPTWMLSRQQRQRMQQRQARQREARQHNGEEQQRQRQPRRRRHNPLARRERLARKQRLRNAGHPQRTAKHYSHRRHARGTRPTPPRTPSPVCRVVCAAIRSAKAAVRVTDAVFTAVWRPCVACVWAALTVASAAAGALAVGGGVGCAAGIAIAVTTARAWPWSSARALRGARHLGTLLAILSIAVAAPQAAAVSPDDAAFPGTNASAAAPLAAMAATAAAAVAVNHVVAAGDDRRGEHAGSASVSLDCGPNAPPLVISATSCGYTAQCVLSLVDWSPPPSRIVVVTRTLWFG